MIPLRSAFFFFFFKESAAHRDLPSSPPRRSPDLSPLASPCSDEETAPADAEAPPGPAPTAEQVFREYAPRVYNLARRMLSNESDAEDVTSEVDRKSTRLNSSHSQISYAVFCLKKK